ncbi:hypothetical protein DFH09DRAFT_1319839 [Mycena vulgaris]|nr:hypothetical protein DFH09DRAFT_1319839 [Mycena vulgaris]
MSDSRRDSPRSAGYGLSPEMLHINPRWPTPTQFIQRLRIDYNKWSSRGGLVPRTACNRISPPARQLAPRIPAPRMLGACHPRDSTQPPALAMHPGFPPCSAALVCPSPSHFVRNHAPPVHYGEVDPRSPHNACVTASPVPPLPARGPVAALPHLRVRHTRWSREDGAPRFATFSAGRTSLLASPRTWMCRVPLPQLIYCLV